ncbi:MAG: hypothetical protein ABIK89_14200 [Planctomycetota bacterium]
MVVFLASTLVQGVGVLAGVVSVAGCVLWTWAGVLSTEWFSAFLTLGIAFMLIALGTTVYVKLLLP